MSFSLELSDVASSVDRGLCIPGWDTQGDVRPFQNVTSRDTGCPSALYV